MRGTLRKARNLMSTKLRMASRGTNNAHLYSNTEIVSKPSYPKDLPVSKVGAIDCITQPGSNHCPMEMKIDHSEDKEPKRKLIPKPQRGNSSTMNQIVKFHNNALQKLFKELRIHQNMQRKTSIFKNQKAIPQPWNTRRSSSPIKYKSFLARAPHQLLWHSFMPYRRAKETRNENQIETQRNGKLLNKQLGLKKKGIKKRIDQNFPDWTPWAPSSSKKPIASTMAYKRNSRLDLLNANNSTQYMNTNSADAWHLNTRALKWMKWSGAAWICQWGKPKLNRCSGIL